MFRWLHGHWWVLTLVAGLLTACGAGRDAAVPVVRVRAQKDLSCPAKKIAVKALWGGRYEATGCGRRTTYHSACEGLVCTAGQEGEHPPGWRDRPELGSPWRP